MFYGLADFFFFCNSDLFLVAKMALKSRKFRFIYKKKLDFGQKRLILQDVGKLKKNSRHLMGNRFEGQR